MSIAVGAGYVTTAGLPLPSFAGMVGTLTTGTLLFTIVTSNDVVIVFDELSLAVHVTVVVPAVNWGLSGSLSHVTTTSLPVAVGSSKGTLIQLLKVSTGPMSLGVEVNLRTFVSDCAADSGADTNRSPTMTPSDRMH